MFWIWLSSLKTDLQFRSLFYKWHNLFLLYGRIKLPCLSICLLSVCLLYVCTFSFAIYLLTGIQDNFLSWLLWLVQQHGWINIFVHTESFRHITSCGIAGPYGNYVCKFLMTVQIDLHSFLRWSASSISALTLIFFSFLLSLLSTSNLI